MGEAKLRRKKDCRKGNHTFVNASGVGGSIKRRVCSGCGQVGIEVLSDAEVDQSKLFAPARLDSMFAIQAVLENAFDIREQRFGVRPDRRRVPSDLP